MNRFASLAIGAAALTAATVGLAEPAAARTNVGVYVSPYGIGVAFNPNSCSDYWFRQNHWDYCAGYGSYGYWPYFGGYYGGYHERHDYDRNRGHDNHWRGDEHRGGNWNGGGRHH